MELGIRNRAVGGRIFNPSKRPDFQFAIFRIHFHPSFYFFHFFLVPFNLQEIALRADSRRPAEEQPHSTIFHSPRPFFFFHFSFVFFLFYTHPPSTLSVSGTFPTGREGESAGGSHQFLPPNDVVAPLPTKSAGRVGWGFPRMHADPPKNSPIQPFNHSTIQPLQPHSSI